MASEHTFTIYLSTALEVLVNEGPSLPNRCSAGWTSMICRARLKARMTEAEEEKMTDFKEDATRCHLPPRSLHPQAELRPLDDLRPPDDEESEALGEVSEEIP